MQILLASSEDLKDTYLLFSNFVCFSCPETNEECLRLAVSLVKVIYWLLIVVTRLLKLCIEVCILCCFASSCLHTAHFLLYLYFIYYYNNLTHQLIKDLIGPDSNMKIYIYERVGYM